MTATAL